MKSVKKLFVFVVIASALGSLRARADIGGGVLCPNCDAITTDLLNRPLREALPLSHLRLRLKKEIYLLGEDIGYEMMGRFGNCNMAFLRKYNGKIVSCSNSDSSPRGFSLSTKDIKVNYIKYDLRNPSIGGYFVIEINPHLPVQELSDISLLVTLHKSARFECSGPETMTLQELVNELSEYYELEEGTDVGAPRI